MSKYTLVVEFEDGKEPAVSGATEILGGRLSFVAFEDIRKYQLDQDEAQALTVMTDEMEECFRDCCEASGADPESIIEKLYQQSI